jgi:type IV fimbrial biogenesis protein FimT
MPTRNRGFSLFELLLTLTLGAILASLAITSFSDLAARQKQRAEIDALFHAIHLARKESILRRKVVSLCPSRDGKQCVSSLDWSDGWLMFENADNDSPPVVDAGEFILRQHASQGDIQIAANRKSFTLRATFLRATNGTLVICDSSGRIPPKALVVSYTGRPRVARHKTNGELYSCAD